jgi:hypothetical protein
MRLSIRMLHNKVRSWRTSALVLCSKPLYLQWLTTFTLQAPVRRRQHSSSPVHLQCRGRMKLAIQNWCSGKRQRHTQVQRGKLVDVLLWHWSALFTSNFGDVHHLCLSPQVNEVFPGRVFMIIKYHTSSNKEMGVCGCLLIEHQKFHIFHGLVEGEHEPPYILVY